MIIRSPQEQFRNQLLEQALAFKSDCHGLVSRFYQDGPFTSDWKTKGDVDDLFILDNPASHHKIGVKIFLFRTKCDKEQFKKSV